MQLRGEAATRFVSLLIDAPSPTERLRTAFTRHDADVESR
jgi:hypothetical protein